VSFYVDTAGWWATVNSSDSLHPYGYANVGTISALFAGKVRDALAAGGSYTNVDGTAKRISPTRVE
jgi:hypothetical protein